MADILEIIKTPRFGYMNNNEIITAWIVRMTIKGQTNLHDLKNNITYAYKKNGISQEQYLASLMAFGLDSDKEQPKTKIDKQGILKILNDVFENHFINDTDYYILLNFGAKYGLIRRDKVKEELSKRKIESDLIDTAVLKTLIDDLSIV